MKSTIVYPLSVMQAFRLFQDDPLYQRFHGNGQDDAFDHFLAKVSYIVPSADNPLSEGQIHDLVDLWVRTRGAAAKVHGPTHMPILTTDEIITRLSIFDRFTDCLPDVPGILTEAYWASFVKYCAKSYGVMMCGD